MTENMAEAADFSIINNKNNMDIESFEIPKDLEILPVGENGEMEVVPVSGKNRLNTSKLPCGLPPILPDTKAMLNSFLENPEKLPIFDLDAVQS
ncbi:uncharacterized protein TNCT_503911 [Trichonephila clavata]|uniref:Uncharacterized protein n=1 Tax=Trichonephila clavata TaxID=2740835 RepID=A0A8X6LYS0_TRICU|nr:uncharacterized protein TNCT_503911 [Trichonephila clavata]